MDRGVKMSTGMLDDMPPEQIEAVLLKIELALHLNAGLAHEGRKIGRHGMGKIHHSGEASGFRRVRGGRRRGKSGRGHTLEKAASTQGCPHRHFTPGDAHGFSILSAHYTCDYTAILFCKVDAGNRLADAGGLVAAIEPSAHFVRLRRALVIRERPSRISLHSTPPTSTGWQHLLRVAQSRRCGHTTSCW